MLKNTFNIMSGIAFNSHQSKLSNYTIAKIMKYKLLKKQSINKIKNNICLDDLLSKSAIKEKKIKMKPEIIIKIPLINN